MIYANFGGGFVKKNEFEQDEKENASRKKREIKGRKKEREQEEKECEQEEKENAR